MIQYKTFWEIKNPSGLMPETATLTFDIFDNPVANSWVNVIEKKLSESDVSVRSHTPHGVFPAFDNKYEVNKILYNHVQEAKKLKDDLYWPADVNDIDQELLNRLHENFHEVQEKYLDSKYPDGYPDELKSIANAFAKINHYVHTLENIIKWQDQPEHVRANRQSYYIMNFGCQDEHLRNPVTAEMRQYWKYTYHPKQKFAQLILGYNTVGKHLLHCVTDNDVQVVTDHMIRPQVLVGGESMLVVAMGKSMVSSYEDADRRNSIMEKSIDEFVEKNNLQSYVDYKNPDFRYSLQPQLGVVSDEHDSWTEEDYFMLCSRYRFVRAEILRH